MVGRQRVSEFDQLLSFAQALADKSGPTVLKYFRKPVSIENKAGTGDFDPVTKADRAAERLISQALTAAYPDHGLNGEEYGRRNEASRYQWVVDPIDGTRAFIMGSPMWGTLIGLLDSGTPILGVLDMPFTAERLWAAEKSTYMRVGGGAPKRMKTRGCPRIEDALLASTHPDLFAGPAQQRTLQTLKKAVRMTRYGGDCYLYALLASGHLDLIVEPGLKTYDIAALIPIVERAGGCVTTWDGGPAGNGGNIIAAGDPRLHEAALRLIAKR